MSKISLLQMNHLKISAVKNPKHLENKNHVIQLPLLETLLKVLITKNEWMMYKDLLQKYLGNLFSKLFNNI